MRSRATIFMLHRFRAPDLGVHEGIDPVRVREGLEQLRKDRCEIVSLGEMFRRLNGAGGSLRGVIAFTIDDGYREQALVGGPLFAFYDCPVTTFVTTGFLDRTIWFWWDRIRYVFSRIKGERVRVRLAGETLDLSWQNPLGLDGVVSTFIERCKTVPDQEKHAAIDDLARAADVELPQAAPLGCDPMSWDELRACEDRGMSFGPHTVTHPILARATDDASRREIEASWLRLSEQAKAPVKVFCYPNGRTVDFGPREMTELARLGFDGAVAGTRGYATRVPPDDGAARFQVPRMEYHADRLQVVRLVNGLEYLNVRLRG